MNEHTNPFQETETLVGTVTLQAAAASQRACNSQSLHSPSRNPTISLNCRCGWGRGREDLQGEAGTALPHCSLSKKRWRRHLQNPAGGRGASSHSELSNKFQVETWAEMLWPRVFLKSQPDRPRSSHGARELGGTAEA